MPTERHVSKQWLRVYGAALACALAAAALGCSTQSQWVKVRDTPRNPLATTLDLLSPAGPKPTERTRQLLRRYDLEKDFKGDRALLLSRLDDLQRREPNPQHEYAMAEIAYITAAQAEKFNHQKALEFYGTALIHAYRYLFEQEAANGSQRAHPASTNLPAPGSPLIATSHLNEFDPQFRGASDLYNQSLEGMLRLVRREGEIRPGMTRTIKTANYACSFDVVLHSSGWQAVDIDRLEFVSDYKVQGLRNHYHTYGLGVPLIVVRRSHANDNSVEQYYPPSVSFPMTAFLRVNRPHAHYFGRDPSISSVEVTSNPRSPTFVLELHDTLDRQSTVVANRMVPLEADLSTPLAYFLNQPQFQDSKLSTLGLLRPGKANKLQGLYMFEPYKPEKMPVVMVHGLWSSPITWMEMYNDLRSDPLVRQHYQFWFYLYPTGQPFWLSATQMREHLALMRRHLDPERRSPALDQMVLVGHSMGGLVSKLQTVESEEAFWRTMSERPFSELNANAEEIQQLATMFYFRPNPSVRRVVTLGTPHRGSEFSNNVTQWLGNKLIKLPSRMLDGRNELLAQNRDYFRPDAPLDIRTSIDSLSPYSPVLPVLLNAPPGAWVAYHNVVGHDLHAGWRKYLVGDGDGVVSMQSARLDEVRQLQSQIIVPADHISVHRHPQSILEVRRVLFEQLNELQNFPHGYGTQVATESAGSARPK